MEKLIFSISTSFYNRGKWVDFMYEQIKSQTYEYWEWVVTDDFSTTDSAEEKLKEIASKDSRVRYYSQSRKKELFYNPNYGCVGNIVMQLDSDDVIYPHLLEKYNKYFNENPDILGITCGHLIRENLEKFVTVSSYTLSHAFCINFAPMGRAWRNVIPHFDREGELKYFQNDINIWRHIEARGKVLFIPRELYVYNQNHIDSISRALYSKDESEEIEKERIKIETRFPIKEDECTFDLRYLPIEKLSLVFYTGTFNSSIEKKSLLLIKTDIMAFEKQLLNGLYYEHELRYNDYRRDKYDEIFAYLNEATIDYLESEFDTIREKYKGTEFRFLCNKEIFTVNEERLRKFVEWSYWASGPLYYGRLVL